VGDKAALYPLSLALDDPKWPVKAAAAEALARILSLMPTAMIRRSQDWVKTALANRDWSVRHAAVGVTSEMDPELAINLLGWAFKDKDPRVRREAVANLSRIRSARTIPILAAALADTSEDVRSQAAVTLGDVKDQAAKNALQGALRDSSQKVRALVAGSLLAQGDASYVDDLKQAARSPKAELRRAAVSAIGKWADAQAEPILNASLKDKDPGVRFAAAYQLAMRGKKDGVPELKKVVGKGGEREREALSAMAQLGIKPTDEVQKLARSESGDSRRAAMQNASELGGGAAMKVLAKGAKDADPRVRQAAASSLGKVGEKNAAALPLLRALAKDPDPAVRATAELALGRLAKKGKSLDLGKVTPVEAPKIEPPEPLPPPIPKVDKKTGEKKTSLFTVDDKSPAELYKQSLTRAGILSRAGKHEAALKALAAAQKAQDNPPVLFELGVVYYAMANKAARQAPDLAREYLQKAKTNYSAYLKRAPGGKLASRAKGGLNDVSRVLKQLK